MPLSFTHVSALLACLLVASGRNLAFADSAAIPFVADGSITKDDCFEFFLANEPGGAATNVYQILVNSRGAKYEGGGDGGRGGARMMAVSAWTVLFDPS